MSGIDCLIGACGRWKGTYRLYEPSAPSQHSKSVAAVTPVMGGRFVRIDYTWSHDHEPQEGSLLCGYDRKKRVVLALWIDSWHMGDNFMICKGTVRKNGAIVVSGSYSVQSSPDWAWRTVIEATSGKALQMVMYNISPDGREELAVQAIFTKGRTGAGSVL